TKMGQHRKALAELQLVIDAAPDYVRAQLGAAEGAFGLHDYKTAAHRVLAAYDIDDTWALVHYWAARIAQVSGARARRKRELSEALRLQPTCYEALVHFALVRWDEGELDDAFSALRQASQIAPWSGLAQASFAEFMLATERGEPELSELAEQARRR